ncbi:hypothetical protein [Paenibacillus tuaregi]|uniref:hypothetical protein n=1 Tax=Paenibacillus tuaregi TaxID=1816681 RepID=UPI000837E337|nr:hypothetical protein [Paenibacillus tuaregi]
MKPRIPDGLIGGEELASHSSCRAAWLVRRDPLIQHAGGGDGQFQSLIQSPAAANRQELALTVITDGTVHSESIMAGGT